ncbi:C-type lectin domain family 9 member A-like [Bos indicus x Bos taurus]|uniref:C-type lectin domain family 9 member A-like n=1 Tax=Bos indicus x Bos taurus TaxID=30522 RepID=UPI000F7D0C4F|nr:C-type lectin domain family 9 member A-like [Bos indicus x Bos taurus]
MKNQKENYSEPSLVKDTKRQQMRDSPSAREKLIVVILGIVCFVLMYAIVRVITSIPHESKNFEESKKSCKEMDSTLLKIEDKEELNFIQSRLSYYYGIGLSRKGTRNQWTWEEKSMPSLKSDWTESNEENCIY